MNLINKVFENKEIYNYLNYCNLNEEYFICNRFFEPTYYKIGENINCPNIKYFKRIYIFCIFNILLNLILSFVPWKLEKNIYDKILKRLIPNNNTVSNSLNTTKNSSKIDKDINKEYFNKAPTEIIIVYNNNINLNENNNNNNNNNEAPIINTNINNEINNNLNISRLIVNNNKDSNEKQQNNSYLNLSNNNNIAKEKNKRISKTIEEVISNKINITSSPPSSTEIFIIDASKNKKK